MEAVLQTLAPVQDPRRFSKQRSQKYPQAAAEKT